MQIPVFVSAPTSLNPEQEASRQRIVDLLDEFGFEARALGRGDYPLDYPLREVAVIARSCFGAVILGFEQFRSLHGVVKPGTDVEATTTEVKSFPTPWNHLEAGILFALRRPLLIFREEGLTGGVFDAGVTDAFVHRMPSGDTSVGDPQELRNLLLRWQGRVRELYYAFD
ncbi:hypothetical protein [Leifsonia shinshuensis]|uniref:hypothetical protein n=1 Tax=Leifsonia shinshuensis TaxID=150026 RepID=UPI0028640155|nr:hypothetical protein [Leifsonia shinshuensis]MDR6971269.1 hypothetical protein [Leifsonia shinshuensis]